MKRKAKIMDETAIKRAVARITHEIIERNQGVDDVCLLGIKTRGIPLSKMLFDNILLFEGKKVEIGTIDVTLHRDDMEATDKLKHAGEYEIPKNLSTKTVIIVDDVLFTGRTARAAMEAIFETSRPKAVQLAVLIDRGHRELPIRPDYVGKNVPTSKEEEISVTLNETDGETGVFILSNNDKE